METAEKKPRRETGLHQRLAAEYALLSLLANLFGSIFWAVEQRRWKIADELERAQWEAEQ